MDTEIFKGATISSKFFKLLESNFIKEHELSFYTETLGVNRQYLHVSVSSSSGKSPGYWIDRYLVREAEKMLVEPNLQIQDVSDRLNFAGSKQFGRFFKTQTGMTPREYRKANNKPNEE